MSSIQSLGPFFYGYIIEVIPHPNLPYTLFARSDVGGLFRSSDGGEHWAPMNQGLAPFTNRASPNRFLNQAVYFSFIYDGRYYVSSLAFDPFDQEHLICSTGTVENYVEDGLFERPATAHGEVFHSINGGISWNLLTDSLIVDGCGENSRVHGSLILFHQGRRGEIWLGTSFDGLHKSTDGGVTWHYIGLRGRNIQSMRFSTAIPDRLILGFGSATSYWGLPSAPGAVAVDALSGEICRIPELEGKVVRCLQNIGSKWYAACGPSGIYRSNDDAISWQPCSKGLPLDNDNGEPYYMSWNSVAICSGNPNHIVTSSFRCLAQSWDGGDSWNLSSSKELSVNVSGTQVDPAEIFSATSSLVISPWDAGTIYASDFFGVWKSSDHGNSWRACRKGLSNTCTKRLVALRPSSSRSPLAALMTDGGVKLLSPDETELKRVTGRWNAGTLITPIRTPEEVLDLSCAASCLAQHPHKPDTLLACQNAGQHGGYGLAVLMRSEDGGKTWQSSNAGLPRTEAWFRDVVFDPNDPDYVLLANGFKAHEGGGIYCSHDGGRTWNYLSDQLLLGYKDADKGASWRYQKRSRGLDFFSQMHSSIDRSLISLANPHTEFIAANRIAGVYCSVDRGKVWDDITANLPLIKSCGLASMLWHSRSASLYVGLYGSGLWRRAGNNWNQIDTGSYQTCTALAEDSNGTIAAAFSPYWFAPSQSGILLLNPDSLVQAEVNCKALPNHCISSMAFPIGDPNSLFVGTIGNGVWRVPINREEGRAE